MADEDDFHDIGDGGGGGDPQQPVQQPAVDLSPIEDRLNRITQAITGLTRDQETREVQSRINTVETQLRQRMTQAETAVTLAERKVAQAYDSGDGTQIARANRELTETIANRESIKADIREFDRYKKDADRQRPAPQTQQQPQAGEDGAKASSPSAPRNISRRSTDRWRRSTPTGSGPRPIRQVPVTGASLPRSARRVAFRSRFWIAGAAWGSTSMTTRPSSGWSATSRRWLPRASCRKSVSTAR
jgi:hypothetical protein